jgi:hypothetical protein
MLQLSVLSQKKKLTDDRFHIDTHHNGNSALGHGGAVQLKNGLIEIRLLLPVGAVKSVARKFLFAVQTLISRNFLPIPAGFIVAAFLIKFSRRNPIKFAIWVRTIGLRIRSQVLLE